MKIKNNYLFIITGLGSIGKRHADYYSKLPGDMIFIDPNKDIQKWARNNYKNKYKFFTSISKANDYIKNSTLKKVGIISNWGTQHYKTLIELNNIGTNRFFIEKPVASSIAQLDNILNLVKEKKIRFVAGFGWRHTGLAEKIKQISRENLGGEPLLITYTGGAFGMVTNGIHYLDLAISIFDSNPVNVVSNLQNDFINPRHNKLNFWEGVSTWNFRDNKRLSINSSNLSSVSPSATIICPKGKLTINENMSLSVFKRKSNEIKQDPRIIRLGIAHEKKEWHYTPDYSKSHDNIITPLLLDDKINTAQAFRDIIATKNMIYALVSSVTKKQQFLDKVLPKKYYFKEWKIS